MKIIYELENINGGNKFLRALLKEIAGQVTSPLTMPLKGYVKDLMNSGIDYVKEHTNLHPKDDLTYATLLALTGIGIKTYIKFALN